MKKSVFIAASVLAFFAGEAYAQGMGGGGMGGGGQPQGERPEFATLDTNSNGSISKEEMMEFSPDRAEAILGRMDADGDGVLSEEEFASGATGGGAGGAMGGGGAMGMGG